MLPVAYVMGVEAGMIDRSWEWGLQCMYDHMTMYMDLSRLLTRYVCGPGRLYLSIYLVYTISISR